jgi:hypothetical protein
MLAVVLGARDFTFVGGRGAIARLLPRELVGPSRTFESGIRARRHSSGFANPEVARELALVIELATWHMQRGVGTRGRRCVSSVPVASWLLSWRLFTLGSEGGVLSLEEPEAMGLHPPPAARAERDPPLSGDRPRRWQV